MVCTRRHTGKLAPGDSRDFWMTLQPFIRMVGASFLKVQKSDSFNHSSCKLDPYFSAPSPPPLLNYHTSDSQSGEKNADDVTE